MDSTLVGAVAALMLVSFLISPRVRTTDGFFRGLSDTGQVPTVLTLTLSQVTTWIFARSLLNAAILGYYYGIIGTVAYAAYYLSFITGAFVVDQIRFKLGYNNIQTFLMDRFGTTGTQLYNVVIAMRLLSEVFANLLVMAVIFNVDAGSFEYISTVIVLAVLTLGYSMMGGLSASLKTDVLQTAALFIVLCALSFIMFGHDAYSTAHVMGSSPDISDPGWVLLVVALLQVISYPMHDPVMMDRGFIANRKDTRRSFLYAFALSVICILAFGLLGVFAGLNSVDGDTLQSALSRLLGETSMVFFSLALVISAISTLDSAFSSASKLTIVDMNAARPTANNGRIAMTAFMLGGLAMVFFGSKDLFDAVAVSGTASMFLTPVIVICIWWNKNVATWAFVCAFTAAMSGAVLYFVETAGYVALMEPLFGISHKYSKLLIICVGVLSIGFGAFLIGIDRKAAQSLNHSKI